MAHWHDESRMAMWAVLTHEGIHNPMMDLANPFDGPLEAVLFDLDGTLIDTEPLWRAQKIALLRQIGYALSDEEIDATIGVHTNVWIPQWLTAAGSSLPSKAVVAQVEEAMVRGINAGMVIAPAVKCAEIVAKSGLQLGIVSASRSALVNKGVAVLPDLFSVVVTGDDVERPKPDPQGYRRALLTLGVSAHTCVVVEDSPSGVAAARAAGCSVVWVTPNARHEQVVEGVLQVPHDFLPALFAARTPII